MKEIIATDVFRLTFRGTDGPLTEEQAAELMALVQAAVSKQKVPKAKYRPAEFPDEVIEQTREDILKLVEEKATRDAEQPATPPTPDAHAAAVAVQRERVMRAAADLAELVRLKVKRKETADE